MKTYRMAVLATLAACLANIAIAGEEAPTSATLYDRLGGAEGIDLIISQTLERHLANPVLAPYFQHLDHEWFHHAASTFFAAGTGGPNHYTGRDVVSAHAHLNISDEVFDTAMADILASVQSNGADATTYEEVAAVLESFRPQVVSP